MLTERAYHNAKREHEHAFPPRREPHLVGIAKHGTAAPRPPRPERLLSGLVMQLQPIDYLYIAGLVAVVVLSAYILIHG